MSSDKQNRSAYEPQGISSNDWPTVRKRLAQQKVTALVAENSFKISEFLSK